MLINHDLSKPAIVHGAQLDWIASPAAGVDRKMLYRVGGEVARATSIVRYAPDSVFPPHTHGGGEEILVLDGVFQDEHGDYPAGTYFRNPPGTSHRPASQSGCTIFVRLWQYREGDHEQIVRRLGEGASTDVRSGAQSSSLLFDDGAERVTLQSWIAGAKVTVDNPRGLELLVVGGALEASGERLVAQSWLRFPAGQAVKARVEGEGALVWIKDAPLEHADILHIPE